MTVKGSERDPELTCNAEDCDAWATKQSDRKACDKHGGKSTGPKSEEGKKKSRMNAKTHGLHQSRETFLEHGGDKYVDKYHAYHESLCTRYKAKHGHLDYDEKDDLAELAFQRTKLDMARDYEVDNAVDPEKPLTEKSPEEMAGRIVETEQLSKVEKLQNDILRETRLTKKDMGMFEDPESQKADAMGDITELWAEDLE